MIDAILGCNEYKRCLSKAETYRLMSLDDTLNTAMRALWHERYLIVAKRAAQMPGAMTYDELKRMIPAAATEARELYQKLTQPTLPKKMSTFFKTFEAYTDNISSYNRNLREIESYEAKIKQLRMINEDHVAKYVKLIKSNIEIFKNDSIKKGDIEKVKRAKHDMFVDQESLMAINESFEGVQVFSQEINRLFDYNDDLKREIDNQKKSMRADICAFSEASKDLLNGLIDAVGLAE